MEETRKLRKDWSQPGVENHNSKLNDDKVRSIRKQRAGGVPVVKLAEQFGVSENTIYKVITNNSWSHVKD